MKSVRYTRYTGDDFGLSAEDLMKALADFFLNSGFDNPYMRFGEFNEHTLDELKQALERIKNEQARMELSAARDKLRLTEKILNKIRRNGG